MSEIEREGADALLPPGLHPTLPPIATWLVQRVPESPWGAFQLAQCRIECRSGLRPRGFLRSGVIDNPRRSRRAGRALGLRAARRARSGSLAATIGSQPASALGGESILDVALRDPMPLRPEDAYTVASMHLAHTPRGLRLLQVDPQFEVERAERGQPLIRRFDASAWSSPGVQPCSPGVGAVHPGPDDAAQASLRLPPRRAGVQGTERVDT